MPRQGGKKKKSKTNKTKLSYKHRWANHTRTSSWRTVLNGQCQTQITWRSFPREMRTRRKLMTLMVHIFTVALGPVQVLLLVLLIVLFFPHVSPQVTLLHFFSVKQFWLDDCSFPSPWTIEKSGACSTEIHPKKHRMIV